jgi:hypothetical protein
LREEAPLLSATLIERSADVTETGTAQQHYRDLIAAVRLIATIHKEVDREEDLGCLPSPAWKMLRNATNYLLKEAHAVLRGDKADVRQPLLVRQNGASSGG